MKSGAQEIKWLADVEAHDYPAAAAYLSLVFGPERVAEVIAGLKAGSLVQYKAKDILRASRLSLLGISNSHVEKDKAKIVKGDWLSPILLLRDERNGRVVIADGYHRLCATYSLDEDAVIPCKIV